MKRFLKGVAALGAALLIPTYVVAAQEADAGKEMSPEEQAMMAAWEKAMTPGPQHAWLAGTAGTWSVESTWWMQPGAPPETSSGTAERSMILGGRVLVERFEGSMMGQPFEGMGTTGYDNVTAAWWGTWMDSMGTGMMATTGSCEDSTCEFSGSYVDPMTGETRTMRMVSEHGSDRETMVMYGPGPDGAEYKMGEMVYTRAK